MAAEQREPEHIDNPLRDALLRRAHRRPVLQDQCRDLSLTDPSGRMPHEKVRYQVVNLQIGTDCSVSVRLKFLLMPPSARM
jgi:hypothetical protein